MDILDPEIRPRLAVLEPRLPRVHDGYFVEVVPERAGGCEVFGADEFDEVGLSTTSN